MATSIGNENVLLGFIDEQIQDETNTSWAINKIGGIPDRFPGHDASVFQVKCQLCGRSMALVVQLACPISISHDHRNLYIFCCINEPCWNKRESWQVIRCQYLGQENTKIDEPISKAPPNQSDPWLMEEDSWGTQNELLVDETMQLILHDDDNQKTVEPNIVACSARCSTSNENSMVVAESPPKLTTPFIMESQFRPPLDLQPILTSFYINVFEETLKSTKASTAEHVQLLLNNYYLHEGNPFYKTNQSSKEKSSKAEEYERTDVKHGDKVFHKFLKRVAEHPQQIIRYCWKGNPLHITSQDSSMTEPPPCASCGSRRVFELQLMPMLIQSLKITNVPTCETPVEFGTVIVSSCEKSCWTNGNESKLEHIELEVDPDEILLRRPSFKQ